MKTWYNMTAKSADEAEVSIFAEIGYWGVTAKAFISDLKKLGSPKKMTLSVNSPGGDVFDGLAIYNALADMRKGGTEITAKVMGIAASAASFIIMSANTVEMPENAMVMVHYASGGAWGNADDMRDTAKILDDIDTAIVGIYTSRTGKDEATIRTLLENETYMSAADAKKNGFADTVTPNVKATASFDIERLPANVQALFKAVQEEGKKSLADQIVMMVEGKGFNKDLAAHFAMSHDTIEEAETALVEAVEMRSLCVVAKKEDKLSGFLTSGKSLKDVRMALLKGRSDEDENANVDTNPKDKKDGTQIVNESKPITTTDVWAKRRAQQNPQPATKKERTQ